MVFTGCTNLQHLAVNWRDMFDFSAHIFRLLTARFVFLPSLQTLFCFLLQQVEEIQWEINLVNMHKKQSGVGGVLFFFLRYFHQILNIFFVLWSKGKKKLLFHPHGILAVVPRQSKESVLKNPAKHSFRLGSFVFAAVTQHWIF